MNSILPWTKVVISTAASVAATAVVVRSVTRDFIPNELRQYLRTKFHRFLTTFSTEINLVIDEFDGLKKNQLFYAAELYVGKIFSPSTKTYRASLPEKEKKIQVSLGGNEQIIDKFCGIHLKWRLVVTEKSSRRSVRYPDDYGSTSTTSVVRFLELTFHKKHKNKVIDEYLPYVLERSESLKEEKKTLKLHTLRSERMHGIMLNPWEAVNLDHPATFETLAMDVEMKKMIIDDLDRFLQRRDLYRKVGKAWKRGYLLYGPPGTGKSSLIAAMANYLNFDVYDLELTDIRANSDLRRLLIATANRSILVVTLSGLLNFIDGLWSSCGDERIIIFTTNHKEKLDPALLRPGRMDMHIHMSYCTPCGFRLLATNYLGMTEEHRLLLEAEELIATTKVTPAQVGEHLLKTDDPQLALCGFINFLQLNKERPAQDHDKIHGLKELIEIAKALPAHKCEEILNKDEVANALKILIGFFQMEIGTASGNTNASDSSLTTAL
ncbi:cytochrome BC1 synthesi [Perilla frutescens var. hirtella]|uniref:Cytochrome BC1 synthesi n=1 Tax=Perilla frutescens var. hirtella TaxID=608512 RepID=A0AAD4IMB9_PERFH|nr:cytochrome BC1 synthesi [Perilla frutescens var. hirtella]